MKLSPNFTLDELTRSRAAETLGDANAPLTVHLSNLRRLAATLEQVRGLAGGPIVVTSGYRNPRVNRSVGGVPNSAHALGLAADIRHPRLTPLKLAQMIAASEIDFDQLILETSRKIVHLSVDKRMRRQLLTQRGGAGTAFEKGLVA